MGCNCKHCEQEIREGRVTLLSFREFFIKRMTEDSETQDRRRKDYNQAIFGFREDGSTYQCFTETDLDMVLKCFDDAMYDWRKSFCDVTECRRH